MDDDGDGAIAKCALGIEAAAVEEVFVEGEEYLVEEAIPGPQAVTTIAGRMGGIASGQVFPRGIVADLPEDSIQDRAGIEGWAAARGLGGEFIEEGLDEAPLLVGEVHGVD